MLHSPVIAPVGQQAARNGAARRQMRVVRNAVCVRGWTSRGRGKRLAAASRVLQVRAPGAAGVGFSPSNDLAVDDEDRSDGDAALEHAFARLVATSARRCARQRRQWKVAESLSRDMPLSTSTAFGPGTRRRHRIATRTP